MDVNRGKETNKLKTGAGDEEQKPVSGTVAGAVSGPNAIPVPPMTIPLPPVITPPVIAPPWLLPVPPVILAPFIIPVSVPQQNQQGDSMTGSGRSDEQDGDGSVKGAARTTEPGEPMEPVVIPGNSPSF